MQVAEQKINEGEKTLSIALTGNPNSGKTTLFNTLTGLNQKTGNYPGVTVDKHTGFIKFKDQAKNYFFQITDLPGIYSLFPKSIDEEVACRSLLGMDTSAPDVVVIVTDSTNLKRHLLLATQIIDLKIPVVLVLNMIDEANERGLKINIEELQRMLGVQVVAVNSRTGEGMTLLKQKITQANISDSSFCDISKFKEANFKGTSYSDLIRSQFTNDDHSEKIQAFEESDNIYRFNTINYIIAKCIQLPQLISKSVTERLDKLVTHRFFGYAIFLTILFVVFQFIFFIADYPMHWIENGFSYLMQKTAATLPEGQLNDLLVNGVLAGLSGIVVFVPQIALLFLFIGLLEDSGYMARVSFIMDKVMRRFGLNGRSVIPVISGAACAVPSILGTRTISNVKERLITIFVIPLMSCSARLPIYTLLISILMPNKQVLGFLSLKGMALMGMYLLGFAATMATAFVLKLVVKNREKSFFIMELPKYRMPQWKSIGVIVVSKIKVFLFEAGKVILAISIILWFLSSHGPHKEFQRIKSDYNLAILDAPNEKVKKELISKMESEKLEASYAGWLGKKMEPVIKPLGFDWKIGIALITSFAAREVFVGTMATIYSAKDSENNENIRSKLEKEKDPNTGMLRYTPAVCLSLLVFYAFAMQCMSTMAVVLRETKSWKWVITQLLYMSGLAYLSAFVVYQTFS